MSARSGGRGGGGGGGAPGVERALRALVEELSRLAGEGPPDPLRSVEYRLEEREEAGAAWAVVATSTSGHGPESAHLIEDEVLVRLGDKGRADLERRSTGSLAPGDEAPVAVVWTPGEPEPLVAAVRSLLEGRPPPSPG